MEQAADTGSEREHWTTDADLGRMTLVGLEVLGFDWELARRTFLGARGMKKGDLSKFIEDVVRWRVFQRTVEDIKARNADADPDEIQRIVEEAVGEVRAERRTRMKVKPDARGARYQHPHLRPDRPSRQAPRDL